MVCYLKDRPYGELTGVTTVPGWIAISKCVPGSCRHQSNLPTQRICAMNLRVQASNQYTFNCMHGKMMT